MNITNRVEINNQNKQEENILYRFGPMGVGITSARPAFFTKTQQIGNGSKISSLKQIVRSVILFTKYV